MVKDCDTCKHIDVPMMDEPCYSCCVAVGFRNWEENMPKPTLEARVKELENQLDVLQSDFNSLLSTLREV